MPRLPRNTEAGLGILGEGFVALATDTNKLVVGDDDGTNLKIGPVTVQDEGTTVTNSASTINFVGAGVAATGTDTVTVTIAGGGGGGGRDAMVEYVGSDKPTPATGDDWIRKQSAIAPAPNAGQISWYNGSGYSFINSGFDNAQMTTMGGGVPLPESNVRAYRTGTAGTAVTIAVAGGFFDIEYSESSTILDVYNALAAWSTANLGSNLFVDYTSYSTFTPADLVQSYTGGLAIGNYLVATVTPGTGPLYNVSFSLGTPEKFYYSVQTSSGIRREEMTDIVL